MAWMLQTRGCTKSGKECIATVHAEVIKTKNACLMGGDERTLEIKQRFSKLSCAKEEHA